MTIFWYIFESYSQPDDASDNEQPVVNDYI